MCVNEFKLKSVFLREAVKFPEGHLGKFICKNCCEFAIWYAFQNTPRFCESV